jgi:hypothetical protein
LSTAHRPILGIGIGGSTLTQTDSMTVQVRVKPELFELVLAPIRKPPELLR